MSLRGDDGRFHFPSHERRYTSDPQCALCWLRTCGRIVALRRWSLRRVLLAVAVAWVLGTAMGVLLTGVV